METDSLSPFTDWLDRSLNFERSPTKGIFWLDTMRFFTERLGHPERAYRCLHVAGSKGKGSISMMCACILQEAGHRVGLYTSPHILDFRERVASPAGFFPDGIYGKAAVELMAAVDGVPTGKLPAGRRPTWFELVTLFAMLCFKYAGCDWAVWEVGLGGRLDSTNVVSPDCCLIGPIEKEHTEFLGGTLEQIAGEKAGIIKRGIPVLVARQQGEGVREVFRRRAAECKSPLSFCDELCAVEGLGYRRLPAAGPIGMDVAISSRLFSRPLRPTLRLLGSFQMENAALAAAAVKTIFPDMDEPLIEEGLSRAALPGRFEIVSPVPGYGGIPALVLDGAHTPRSVALTMESFSLFYGGAAGKPGPAAGLEAAAGQGGKDGGGDAVLLFACAADKDVEDIAPLFKGRFGSVFLTRPGGGKACDMERMEAAFGSAGMEAAADRDYRAAIGAALRRADGIGQPLLVTGSFYLVSEVKKQLAGMGAEGN